MYEYLDGRLVSRGPTRVVIDVAGIGYDVRVPVGADFRTPRSVKEGAVIPEAVRVWTHLVVREDAHLLYGFPDPEAREIFRLLLQVRGVGPGLAQGILSSLPGEALLAAIAKGDAAALTRIKGVGKKTADQILLDLRDRSPGLPAGAQERTAKPASAATEDAVRALVSIGYTDKQARKSVERASEKVSLEDLELLVRTALQE